MQSAIRPRRPVNPRTRRPVHPRPRRPVQLRPRRPVVIKGKATCLKGKETCLNDCHQRRGSDGRGAERIRPSCRSLEACYLLTFVPLWLCVRGI